MKYPIRIGPAPFLFNLLVAWNFLMFCSAVVALWYSSHSSSQFAAGFCLYGLSVLPVFALFLFLILRVRKTMGLLVDEHEARIGELCIPWGEISSAFLDSNKKQSASVIPQAFLCLSLRAPEQFWLRNVPLRKHFERAKSNALSVGVAPADFYVLLNVAKQTPHEALEIVRSRIEAYS